MTPVEKQVDMLINVDKLRQCLIRHSHTYESINTIHEINFYTDDQYKTNSSRCGSLWISIIGSYYSYIIIVNDIPMSTLLSVFYRKRYRSLNADILYNKMITSLDDLGIVVFGKKPGFKYKDLKLFDPKFSDIKIDFTGKRVDNFTSV